MRRIIPPLFALALTALLGAGCDDPDESFDYGIVEPITSTTHALTAGGLGPKGPSPEVMASSNTEVWKVTENWADTDTASAREAGLAWGADSGLNWEQKYSAWVQGLEKTISHSGSYDTFELTNPQGKTLPMAYLECAETAYMLRAMFASWYGLPFYMQAQDGNGDAIYLGHFGFITKHGRYKNTPRFKANYPDYTGLSDAAALADWPVDEKLRKRHIWGGSSDNNPFLRDDAGAGYYFDELLLNKRVGHFLMILLPYFGSINLVDDANAYHVTPESLRAGDVLLERWQKTGIGHVMIVKNVTDRGAGKKLAEIASGSMPRRQPKWENDVSSKRMFTDSATGGEGESWDGDAYVDLGGGVKRFLSATLMGGVWRNRVLSADLDNYIPYSNKEARAARPAQFEEMLAEVSPEDLRDELLAIIESKREWLRDHPSSCSARTGREGAFEDLYELMDEKFDWTRDEVDAEYRNKEDYVFAELVYTQSKTCCWNSSNRNMYDIAMSYTDYLQEQSQSCLTPTVFKARDGDYELFAAYAESIDRGDEWRPWSADESCPQGDNTGDDLEATPGWTPYCSVFDPTDTGTDDPPVNNDPDIDPCNDGNESLETATKVGEGIWTGLAICEGEEDWFRVPATTGAFTARIEFDNSQGDLDMELYRSNGEKLDQSTSTDNVERIESSPGLRFLRVFGYRGATNEYSLIIE